MVTKGTLYMKEEENTYSVTEGEYIVLAPHLEHVGNKKCTEETEYSWIHFTLSSNYKLVEETEVDWSNIIKRENTFIHSDLYELFIPRNGDFQKVEHAKDLFNNLLQLNDSNDPAERMKQQTYFFEIIVQLQKEALEGFNQM
ncbi:AraC family ligand binding domain-containing protein [Salipaludibacillus sp. CF4.18]|uniref:AraC family ligand binding domain-containing protein n=1 Tax=Salipaludibacillus sp. CF4.18 TaxID=3373081 RepID=UPI003EE79D5B